MPSVNVRKPSARPTRDPRAPITRILAPIGLIAALALAYWIHDPTATSLDPRLAKAVPASIRADGVLTIGTDPTYEPSQFTDDDGNLAGIDIDLSRAIARKLGLGLRWRQVTYDNLVPAVRAGGLQLAISAIPVTDHHTAQVTMISYLTTGSQWLGRTTERGISPDNACGSAVAVVAATVHTDDLAARSAACLAARRPAITIHRYPTQQEATTAVQTGATQAMVTESHLSAYTARHSHGALRRLGDTYDPVTFGIAVNSGQRAFAETIAQALRALIDDGTYADILDHWAIPSAALKHPTIRP